MRRILFLDIDGVTWGWKKTTWRSGHADKEIIDLLNTLLPYNIEVVLTSSWKEDGKKMLEERGLKLPIIGWTERISAEWACRGNEIEQWMIKNLGHGVKFGNEFDDNGDYKFAIADDEEDMLLGQRNFFVHIDGNQGINEEDFRKIKNLLV